MLWNTQSYLLLGRELSSCKLSEWCVWLFLTCGTRKRVPLSSPGHPATKRLETWSVTVMVHKGSSVLWDETCCSVSKDFLLNIHRRKLNQYSYIRNLCLNKHSRRRHSNSISSPRCRIAFGSDHIQAKCTSRLSMGSCCSIVLLFDSHAAWCLKWLILLQSFCCQFQKKSGILPPSPQISAQKVYEANCLQVIIRSSLACECRNCVVFKCSGFHRMSWLCALETILSWRWRNSPSNDKSGT